ncbi:MAG TPA: GNAT family N-acetyltransferase [Labilithrix sp.]|nr:GNAT family N-acetyltransferase [Labilithrix sp.]
MPHQQTIELRAVDADGADAMRLLETYFAELRSTFGSFTAPSLADLRADGEGGVVLVAYDEGLPVACGSLRRLDDDTAEVKRMFVLPEARGRGLGRQVLRALEERARSLNCVRVVLDTAAPLEAAATMYLREGYREVARYNDNPYATRWFEKRLASR